MGDDLRVTVRLGFNLPAGDFVHVKPEVVLEHIDPAGDVAAQVTTGLEAAVTAFLEIDGRLASTLANLVEGVRLSVPAEVQRLDMLERSLDQMRGSFNELVVRLREDRTATLIEADMQRAELAEDAEADAQ